MTPPPTLSSRLMGLRVPNGAGPELSTKAADLRVKAACAADVLDTTHFDTVRFPPPPYALDLFNHAAQQGQLAYTPYRGNSDVLEIVAERVSNMLQLDVSPRDNIVLTPGTQAGLFAALSSIVDRQTRVIMPTPEYVFDERILGFLGAEVVTVPLATHNAVDELDLDSLEESAANGGGTLLFSHPNNPTGALYSRSALERLARIAVDNDLLVVVDELYSRLVHDNADFFHLAALPGMADRCVTLLGPSKTESLSGYRLGVAVGPADLVDAIEDVLSVTALRAPGYAQHVLAGWLDDDDWLSERLAAFANLREITVKRLQQLPWISVQSPPATAYVFPDVSALGLPDVVVAERLASDANVLVSPGYQFGPGGRGSFRLCYARDEQAWDAALDRIVATLDHLAAEQGIDSIQQDGHRG